MFDQFRSSKFCISKFQFSNPLKKRTFSEKLIIQGPVVRERDEIGENGLQILNLRQNVTLKTFLLEVRIFERYEVLLAEVPIIHRLTVKIQKYCNHKRSIT